MKKTILTLGDIEFEYEGTTTRQCVKQRDIRDCYSRPSSTKLAIWSEWVSWFMRMNIWEYGVSSYNCNFFSINAIYHDTDSNKNFMLVITAAHNRIYEIV